MEQVFHTLTNNGDAPRDPDVPGGRPPDNNNLDFDDPLPDPNPKDDDKAYCDEEQPQDPLVQLTQVIQSLTRASCCPTSNSAPRTKVWEPDQFDRMDPCKLRVFPGSPKGLQYGLHQSYVRAVVLEGHGP